MTRTEQYMQRCFDLARLGAGNVSPNPMVGAVLVHNDRIIGEGFHQRYGEAHAEVNAVRSVQSADRHLISKATLYVSLEPCSIFGRTPPCTNLIISQRLPKVVISCLDQTPGVAGMGVQILREHGVEVITSVLEAQGKELARFRNHFVTSERPYVILKFAQSINGYIGLPDKQIWLSNAFSKRLVHKWRSELDAILVGTQTALTDNPQLNNRLYFGKSPLRIVLDRDRKLPPHLHLFDGSQPTLIVTNTPSDIQHPTSKSQQPVTNLQYLSLDFGDDMLSSLLRHLHQQKITTLLVEGGARLLQSFIDAKLWDEAFVFQTNRVLTNGIPAPHLPAASASSYFLGNEQIIRYRNGEIR